MGGSEQAESFPQTSVDVACFASWVGRLKDAQQRIKDTLDLVPMDFSVAVAVWQQLERQYDLIAKTQRILEARQVELDAAEEGEDD